MNILSGGAYYQKVFNFSEANRGHENDDTRYARAYYEFPFNFKKRPERVAIVGAGSGNDVAAALRMSNTGRDMTADGYAGGGSFLFFLGLRGNDSRSSGLSIAAITPVATRV